MPSRKSKTITISEGSATVKIFYTPTGPYRAWEVVHSFNGRRVRRKFNDIKKARGHARTVARQLDRGDTAVFSLTAQDQAVYAAALNRIQPTGKSLEVAAGEYADAVMKLVDAGLDVSLAEVVSDYIRRHPVSMPRLTVPEAVRAILDARRTDGVGSRHISDLTSRLNRFAAAFQMPMVSLTAQAMDDWIRSMTDRNGKPLGPRSRNNYRLALANLFNFARKRRWLPPDWDEIERVEVARLPRDDIGIFTPEEMTKLMASAPEKLRPILALGAFAGLRTSEIQRLRWQDIKPDAIVVPIQSKTGRRLAPVTENLMAWLRPGRPTSHVCTLANVSNAFKRLSASTGVSWQHNGLRHSFVSYRVAAVQNIEQVSLECGHSPMTLRKHYRELVTTADAVQWFGILP